MTKAEFNQQAQPILAIVDAMLETFIGAMKTETFVTVSYEGIEWCVSGGYVNGEYEPTKIWLASDPARNDLIECLKGIVIDDLADLAGDRNNE